jgi:hypothetical protein
MTTMDGVEDRDLEEVLADRAARSSRDGDAALLAAVSSRVHVTRQDRLVPLMPLRWERVAWVASVATALVIGLGVGVLGPRWLAAVGSTASAPASMGASTFPTQSAVPAPSSWVPDGDAVPLLPQQLAAAIPRHEGEVVVVQGRMEPGRRACPTGPAGCWVGTLDGDDGPEIFGDPQVVSGWTGGASGYLVLRVRDGTVRYIGTLKPHDESVVSWKPSELATLHPSEWSGSLFLVYGSVQGAPCRGGTTCPTVTIGDRAGDGSGDTIVLNAMRGTGSLPSTGDRSFIVQPTFVGEWQAVSWLPASARLRIHPVPTCDGVDGDLCAALADLAIGDTPGVVAVDVGPFEVRCQPNTRCARPSFTNEVVATLPDGSGRAWGCTADASGLSCQARSAEELSALGTVRVVVGGAPSRYVVFVNDQGSDFDLTVDGTRTVQLTRGRWQMLSYDVAPPGPASDMCPSTLDVDAGAQLELRITVTNGVCTPEVAPDASPRS